MRQPQDNGHRGDPVHARGRPAPGSVLWQGLAADAAMDRSSGTPIVRFDHLIGERHCRHEATRLIRV
jgi:hypothetical protein